MKKRKLLCGLMSHMTKMATKSIKGKTFRNRRTQCHPAGDVLWDFVEPGNVVP